MDGEKFFGKLFNEEYVDDGTYRKQHPSDDHPSSRALVGEEILLELRIKREHIGNDAPEIQNARIPFFKGQSDGNPQAYSACDAVEYDRFGGSEVEGVAAADKCKGDDTHVSKEKSKLHFPSGIVLHLRRVGDHGCQDYPEAETRYIYLRRMLPSSDENGDIGSEAGVEHCPAKFLLLFGHCSLLFKGSRAGVVPGFLKKPYFNICVMSNSFF